MFLLTELQNLLIKSSAVLSCIKWGRDRANLCYIVAGDRSLYMVRHKDRGFGSVYHWMVSMNIHLHQVSLKPTSWKRLKSYEFYKFIHLAPCLKCDEWPHICLFRVFRLVQGDLCLRHFWQQILHVASVRSVVSEINQCVCVIWTMKGAAISMHYLVKTSQWPRNWLIYLCTYI